MRDQDKMSELRRGPQAASALNEILSVSLLDSPLQDDQAVRRFAGRVLAEGGYTVLQAGDPLEALALCEGRGEPIQLLLTDLTMPHMNGVELAKRLTDRLSGLRVVVMSGYTGGLAAAQEPAGPARFFLQKPVSSETLLRRVREALDAPQA